MNAIAEKFNLAAILQHYRAGNSTTKAGYLVTNGVSTVSVVCPILTGHATAMTLTLETANDNAGTGATALTENVRVYINGERQADAKAATIPNTFYGLGKVANFVVFEIPAIILPEGKYLTIGCDAGNSGNYYTAIAVEDTYYKG